MRTVIQRVQRASVKIAGKATVEIGPGLLILLGIEAGDDRKDIDWLVRKTVNLRIFGDEKGVMNRSLKEVGGEALVVSQFTLHASTKKGNRPSYHKAAKSEISIPLYEDFVHVLENELEKEVATGEFGADMHVSLVNDGPVTILMDSKNRE